MSDARNPWVTSDPTAEETVRRQAPAAPVEAPATRRELYHGVQAPQPGIFAPATEERLPHRQVPGGGLWWLGVHGGAGESVLQALLPGTQAASHAWPISRDGVPSQVILVARTHSAGLRAAQRAATEWASGSFGNVLEIHGLALIADAPGRLPKPLRDLAQTISGGVPRTWMLPWVESWRTSPASLATAPREYKALLNDLGAQTS
jgi:hypothetical protein